MSASANALLVFLKAPVPGGVKLRLAKDLEPEAGSRARAQELAAAIYASMAQEVVRTALGRENDWTPIWLYQPDPSSHPGLDWVLPAGEPFWHQHPGDLGERLAAAFDRAFREGADRVCAIGTDSPWLTRERILEAFAALDTADLVLGPAEDGGYYLIALKRHEPKVFQDIPWSTARTLAATLDQARKAHLKVRELREGCDVDDLASYDRWRAAS